MHDRCAFVRSAGASLVLPQKSLRYRAFSNEFKCPEVFTPRPVGEFWIGGYPGPQRRQIFGLDLTKSDAITQVRLDCLRQCIPPDRWHLTSEQFLGNLAPQAFHFIRIVCALKPLDFVLEVLEMNSCQSFNQLPTSGYVKQIREICLQLLDSFPQLFIVDGLDSFENVAHRYFE
jgi:hypothetical protein